KSMDPAHAEGSGKGNVCWMRRGLRSWPSPGCPRVSLGRQPARLGTFEMLGVVVPLPHLVKQVGRERRQKTAQRSRTGWRALGRSNESLGQTPVGLQLVIRDGSRGGGSGRR